MMGGIYEAFGASGSALGQALHGTGLSDAWNAQNQLNAANQQNYGSQLQNAAAQLGRLHAIRDRGGVLGSMPSEMAHLHFPVRYRGSQYETKHPEGRRFGK